MHTLSLRRLLALSALTLTLGACGDSTGSDDSERGEVQFSYSGAVSGQFNAAGEFNSSASSLFEFAAAIVDVDGLQLLGVEKTATGRGNLFIMIAPAEQRTFTCTATSFDCEVFAGLALGVSDDSEEVDESFSGDLGSVEVTSISDRRVRGRFSFTLGNDAFQGAASSIQVRSGTFDVPILDESELQASGMRAAAARMNARRAGPSLR